MIKFGRPGAMLLPVNSVGVMGEKGKLMKNVVACELVEVRRMTADG